MSIGPPPETNTEQVLKRHQKITTGSVRSSPGFRLSLNMDERAEKATITVLHASDLPRCHALQLVEAIVNYGYSTSIHNETPPLTKIDISNVPLHDLVPWTINNKYYSADVGFRIVSHEASARKGMPAIVVVAPSTQVPSPNLKGALSYYSSLDPDVALLITLNPSSTTEGKATVDDQKWDDFAYDHGFEWVDLSSTEEGSDAMVFGKQGTNREESERGIGRIVAALHAHVWEEMQLHSPRHGVSDAGNTTTTTEEKAASQDFMFCEPGDDDLEAFNSSAHLHPSLPPPRHIFTTPVTFPDTFLPSIRQPMASLERADSDAFVGHKQLTICSDDSAFDDDFAPFEHVCSSVQFPTWPSVDSSERHSGEKHKTKTELAGRKKQDLPSLSDIASDPGSRFDDEGAEPQERDAEFTELYDRMRECRAKASTLGMMERRAYAEDVIKGLLEV